MMMLMTTVFGILQSIFIYFTFILLFFDFQNINGLFLTNLTVPRVVDFRDKAKLSCTYDMGTHKLNSVKWYKDGSEFFRYSPMTPRAFLIFSVNGVSISSRDYFCNQFICNVELMHLSKNSSGAYRCEVSGDAPEFKLVGQQANMTVGVMPQYGPVINGAMIVYRFSDHVSVNCASDWSLPAPTLSWYINDKLAPEDFQQPEEEQIRISDGFNLYLKSKELQFYIDDTALIAPNGKLMIRCVSDIMKIPILSRETSIKATVLSKDDLNNEKLVNSLATRIDYAVGGLCKFIYVIILLTSIFNIQFCNNFNFIWDLR